MKEAKIIYAFTPDERRIIQEDFQRYTTTVQIIARLHNVTNAVVSPDNAGFIEMPQPTAQG